jgi:hypothetical protein
MQSYWSRNGPPLPVVARVIGQALGIDWKTDQTQRGDAQIAAPPGPSIAEMATTVVPLS